LRTYLSRVWAKLEVVQEFIYNSGMTLARQSTTCTLTHIKYKFSEPVPLTSSPHWIAHGIDTPPQPGLAQESPQESQAFPRTYR